MPYIKFTGKHIILQVKGKVNRLAKETIRQKSNKYQLSCQFLIAGAFGDQGAFLKNRPPGPPEKLFIALRAVGFPPFEGRRDTIVRMFHKKTGGQGK